MWPLLVTGQWASLRSALKACALATIEIEASCAAVQKLDSRTRRGRTSDDDPAGPGDMRRGADGLPHASTETQNARPASLALTVGRRHAVMAGRM